MSDSELNGLLKLRTQSDAKGALNDLTRTANPDEILQRAQLLVDVVKREIGGLLSDRFDEPANDNSDRGYVLAYVREIVSERVRFYELILGLAEAGVGAQVKLPTFDQLVDPDVECTVTPIS